LLIFISILFLTGAVLPLALETIFSSDELLEMGVYLEDLQSMPAAEDELNNPQSAPLCQIASLSA